jgi:anti-sigma regulatory factor (Ser/Thr protein kinase)
MFYSQSFPKSPSAAAHAREMVAQLDGNLPSGMLEDARLLTSELVANAVEHVPVGTEIEVRMDLSGERLRVEVYDSGAGFEWVPRRADAGNERGWGLHFTDAVSSRWAVEHGERNCVWFELDLA